MAIRDLIVRVTAESTDFERKIAASQRALISFSERAGAVSSISLKSLSLPIVGFGASILGAAASMESLKLGLTAVTGSAAAAEAEFQRLKKVAELPGLGLQEAVKGATRLQAAGLSASIAERALRSFGNAIATVGGGRQELDGVTLALSQIASKGKVSAEEINQLAERLPQVRVALKEAFGTADTELIQKLGLTTDQFFEKLISQFEKLPSVTGGLKNSFENLRDKGFEALANLGAAVAPFAAAFLDAATPVIGKIGELGGAFAQLPQSVQTVSIAIAGLAAAVFPLSAIVSKLAELRVAFLGLQALLVANPLGATIAGGLLLAGGAIAITSQQLDDLNRRYDELGKSRNGAKTLNELIEAAKRGDPDIKNFGASVGDLGVRLAKTAPTLAFAEAMKRLGAATLPEVNAAAAQAREALDAVQAAFRRGEASAFDVANATKAYHVEMQKLGLETAATTEKHVKHREAVFSLVDIFRDLNAELAKRTEAARLQAEIFSILDGITGVRDITPPAGVNLRTLFEKAIDPAERLRSVLGAVQGDINSLASSNALEQFGIKVESATRGINVAPAPTGDQVIQDILNARTKAAEQAATDAGKAQFGKLSENARRVRQEISTVITDLSRGIVDVIGNAKTMGEAFRGVALDISRALLRHAIEGGINLLIDGLETVIGKLFNVGKLFGSVFSGAAGSIGGAAGSVGGAAAGGAGSAASAASSGILGAVGAISSAVSAVFDVLQFTQLRRMEQDLGRVEVTTRGQLNQLISIQSTLNQWLPMLNNLGTGGGGTGGTTIINNYITNGDPRAVASEIMRTARLAGVSV